MNKGIASFIEQTDSLPEKISDILKDMTFETKTN